MFAMSSSWEMVTHPHTRKCPLPSRMAMSRFRSSSVLVTYRREKNSGIFAVSNNWELVLHPHTRKCPLPSRMAMTRLRSSSVLEDGDSSSYNKESTSQPYGDVQVEKLKCIWRW